MKKKGLLIKKQCMSDLSLSVWRAISIPRFLWYTLYISWLFLDFTAMKQDRKRLKGEKVDLLNQMKQLYCTLESKEEEMRDFLRNYEQRVNESDENLKKIIGEKEEVEKDRWEKWGVGGEREVEKDRWAKIGGKDRWEMRRRREREGRDTKKLSNLPCFRAIWALIAAQLLFEN